MTRSPDGPATLRIALDGATVDAHAWGPGAGWILDQAPLLLGQDDEPALFAPQHDIIDRLWRRFKSARFGRSDRVFETVLPTVLGQKVTTTEAHRSFRRILRTLGEQAPGPVDLRLQPSPNVVASLDYADFHPLGVERKRAETIIRAARRAKRLEEITSMSPADAHRRVMAFPGLGVWTAGLVLAEAMGDPDALPVGDYHLPNTVTWVLAGEARGTDARMLELLEPYAGHRGRVLHLLKLGHFSAPKYGPKSAVRSIDGI